MPIDGAECCVAGLFPPSCQNALRGLSDAAEGPLSRLKLLQDLPTRQGRTETFYRAKKTPSFQS